MQHIRVRTKYRTKSLANAKVSARVYVQASSEEICGKSTQCCCWPKSCEIPRISPKIWA